MRIHVQVTGWDGSSGEQVSIWKQKELIWALGRGHFVQGNGRRPDPSMGLGNQWSQATLGA